MNPKSPLTKAALALVLLAGLTQGMAMAAAPGTPDLPGEFKDQKPGIKVTFLEFSAPWCRSCQKLQPSVEALKKEAGTKLNIVYMNIEKPTTQKYIDLYGIASVPTYVLYNDKGKLIRRVDGDITPEELRSVVLKATGQQK